MSPHTEISALISHPIGLTLRPTARAFRGMDSESGAAPGGAAPPSYKWWLKNYAGGE